jgi:hypothetical protein
MRLWHFLQTSGQEFALREAEALKRLASTQPNQFMD